MFGLLKLGFGVIWFPLMALIAVGHGVFAAIGWAVLNFGWILGFVVWPWTTARACSSRIPESGDKVAPFVPPFLLTLVTFVTSAVILFGRSAGGENYRDLLAAHPLAYIPLGFLAVCVLSGLYEGGRAYWRYLSNEDEAVAKSTDWPVRHAQDKPDTFGSMWDKIRDMETISLDESKGLYADVIQLLKEDKITGQDAVGLATAIHNGATETNKLQSAGTD